MLTKTWVAGILKRGRQPISRLVRTKLTVKLERLLLDVGHGAISMQGADPLGPRKTGDSRAVRHFSNRAPQTRCS
jgi:hypothetical protein